MKVEMTGKEDRVGPWNVAIAGHPGVGKTLFASTSPEPLFLFFKDNPPLKSIANRHVPHIKITNDVDADGFLAVSVMDKMRMLLMQVQLGEFNYDTIVFDTANEFYAQMKEARRLKNGGEFEIGDWGWIADTYREIMTAFIDLPVNIIALYHVKSAQDDEGRMYKELMLQGQSKDEAPSWFDVVGVLEAFEVLDDTGEYTKRVLLTNGTRTYPWLKDHSGAMPQRFDISRDFVGDWDRMYEIFTAEDTEYKEDQNHVVLEEFGLVEEQQQREVSPVPTPLEVDEKKKSKSIRQTIVEKSLPTVPDSEPAEVSSGPDVKVGEEQPETLEEAIENVKSVLGSVSEVPVCASCGDGITDENIRDISHMRLGKYLCRPCYIDQK